MGHTRSKWMFENTVCDRTQYRRLLSNENVFSVFNLEMNKFWYDIWHLNSALLQCVNFVVEMYRTWLWHPQTRVLPPVDRLWFVLQKLQTIGEDFCGLDVNTPLGGETPMAAVPVAVFNNHLTAIAATSTGDYTVVFVGTSTGHLKKVGLHFIISIQLQLQTISVLVLW